MEAVVAVRRWGDFYVGKINLWGGGGILSLGRSILWVVGAMLMVSFGCLPVVVLIVLAGVINAVQTSLVELGYG